MCCASVYANGVFAIFAGGGYRCSEESYEYDIETNEWCRLALANEPACSRPTVVYTAARLLFYGGCSSENGATRETALELLLSPLSLKQRCQQWTRRLHNGLLRARAPSTVLGVRTQPSLPITSNNAATAHAGNTPLCFGSSFSIPRSVTEPTMATGRGRLHWTSMLPSESPTSSAVSATSSQQSSPAVLSRTVSGSGGSYFHSDSKRRDAPAGAGPGQRAVVPSFPSAPPPLLIARVVPPRHVMSPPQPPPPSGTGGHASHSARSDHRHVDTMPVELRPVGGYSLHSSWRQTAPLFVRPVATTVEERLDLLFGSQGPFALRRL